MKRKTIKAKIAAVLSAGMAIAMLAPAMPAYAADVTITFDFDTNTPSLDPDTEHKITVSGPLGSPINTTTAGLQTGTNGVLLPWGNGTTYPTQSDGTGYTGTVGGKKWGKDSTGLDLVGYKIREFRKAPGVGDFPRSKLDSGRYQSATYYATLVPDENVTSAMKLDIQHLPDTTDPDTTYFPVPAGTPKEHKVMYEVFTTPYTIPG